MKNLLNLGYKDVKPIVTKLEEGEIIVPEELWEGRPEDTSGCQNQSEGPQQASDALNRT